MATRFVFFSDDDGKYAIFTVRKMNGEWFVRTVTGKTSSNFIYGSFHISEKILTLVTSGREKVYFFSSKEEIESFFGRWAKSRQGMHRREGEY